MTMKLAQMTLAGFTEVLSSHEPAPGGGSAAALEGALGAALAAMVAAFTVGRKKYAEYESLALDVQKKANVIGRRLVEIIDRDTEAFNGVSAVFAMPKDTEEQKAARKSAMQAALKNCTETPFEMMELSAEALRLIESLLGRSNASAVSDLGVGALSLKAAMQGAWLNILINVAGIDDTEFTAHYRKEGEALLAKALPMADQIYETVVSSL